MTTKTAIHDRVTEAILDATADLLAEGGEPPSMSDVAGAAGISRATLYRYFPTREQLLEALAAIAIDTTATGLARADLSVEELLFLLGYLLQAAARMAGEGGVEKAAALVTSVFLHGTENRKDAPADA